MKDPHERYPSEKAFAQAFGQAIVPLTLSLSSTPLTLTNRQSQMGLTQNQSLSLSRQDVAPLPHRNVVLAEILIIGGRGTQTYLSANRSQYHLQADPICDRRTTIGYTDNATECSIGYFHTSKPDCTEVDLFYWRSCILFADGGQWSSLCGVL